eukprot:TRINITY_DN5285_c0_g3_i1.p1 TRINITY_DN5285_c0_g3~~TRINITY_DN5285_c0_g3_i1.p1  ORF type:complete len:329 (+),score=97.89 TRINITY_DN5285_c0_g3_i1:25-987(+)
MLCEVQISGNFFVTWMTLNALALVALLTMSGSLFYVYYQRATFEKWQNKSNPKYPTPEIVRSEIIQMLKGMCSATLCPALSLYLAQHNHSQAFCGWGGYSVWYHLGTFLVCWIATDFWEFYYHRLGHTTQSGWDQHKYHHIFYNPSPFAVIADEYIDQFVRAAPLAIFPMLMPINMDLLFAQFVIFFYAYGVYLHWGYELPWLSAHHPIINTSFQHYCHHALSIKNKPMHTGFFFKLWDNLFDSVYKGECFCAACARAKGERSLELWQKVKRYDYSVMLTVPFWQEAFRSKSAADLAKSDSATFDADVAAKIMHTEPKRK